MRRILILSFFVASCGAGQQPLEKKNSVHEMDTAKRRSDSVKKNIGAALIKDTCELERAFIEAGLVNIHDLDSTIRVRLRYSTNDNFLGLDVYGDLEHCYLQKDVAIKLAIAQTELRRKKSEYSLLVYDGVRPVHIQQLMWDTIRVDPKERGRYVSNPARGSLHNYGAAVDVTICDEKGKPLDMGTDFDFFGEMAYPVKEKEMADSGKLSHVQISNRTLLRSVMYKAGFFGIQTEWWHFNSCRRDSAAKWYPLIK